MTGLNESKSNLRTAGRLFRRGFFLCCVWLVVCPGAFQAIAQEDSQAPPPPPYDQQDSQQQPPQGYPDQQAAQQSPANVARLSFAEGSVQMVVGGQTDFQQAVVNMPVVDGSVLKTGADGQAEVAFSDGSVARLTPNSSLQVDHLGPDGVEVEQQSGLGYYELNVGDGHPPFRIEFPGGTATPTENAIFRLDLDNIPEVAVMVGNIQVAGEGTSGADVSENQSIRFEPSNGAPYTVAQTITPDSWDQWNQDRDQEISQEASQQTTVRDSSANAADEGWNDLDYYGNWYPVEGAGDVWVPAGVDSGWDPYGSGYWGFYPGMGYTWISSYPWGWLPYHCGVWSYYSFGWGWAPGGCGRSWVPLVGVHGYPGYFIPARPVLRPHAGHPIPGQRLVAVDRGPRSRGPWGIGRSGPRANHEQPLRVGGREVLPVQRRNFNSQGFAGNRGTTPGVRGLLGTSMRTPNRNVNARPVPGSQIRRVQPRIQPGVQPAQPRMQPNQPRIQTNQPQRQGYRTPMPAAPRVQPRVQQPQPRMQPNQPRPNNFQRVPDSRSNYVHQTPPTAHYSTPPPRSMAPAPHYSAAPAPRSAPGGGGHGRR